MLSRRHRRSNLGANAAIDLTPMVDVVFLLIIFFMLTTTFITVESGLPVDLPEAQTSVASPSNLPTVTINGLGEVFFGGAQVAETELAALVRQSLAESGQRTVVLRADRDVPHGQAVRVMDIIRQAGAERIAIATGG
ncbi:MAG TPA: biopolymer transporter ExbD [Trueperaceae bacterium]|nr:biopolymer transporter ExbD [Trueperaceae bacterium]